MYYPNSAPMSPKHNPDLNVASILSPTYIARAYVAPALYLHVIEAPFAYTGLGLHLGPGYYLAR